MNRKYRSPKRGASLVEYALLVALIAIATIAAMNFLGFSIKCGLYATAKRLPGVGTNATLETECAAAVVS